MKLNKASIICFAAFLLATKLAHAGTSAEFQDSITIANFARRLDIPFIKVSPNGKTLATSMQSKGIQRLYVLDTEKLQPLALAHTLGNVSELEWLDEYQALVVADDAFDVSQIFRVNMQTGAVKQLTNHQNILENRFISLQLFPSFTFANGIARFRTEEAGNGYYLFSIDLNTDVVKRELRFTHPLDRIVPDIQHHIRLIEEWSGDKYSLVYYPIDRQSSESIYSGTYWDKSQIHPLAIIPHSDSVYVSTTDAPTREIRILDLKTKRVGDPVLSDPKYDVDAVPLYLPYTGEVFGFQYERDRPVIHYLDPNIAAAMKKIELALPNRLNRIVSASKNKALFVILSSSERQAGEYYLYDTERKSLRPLLARADWLKEEHLFTTQTVNFFARDGLAIEAYVTNPRTKVKDSPLIVMPHGGPHARDTLMFQPLVQFLASRGYSVIQPNFRLSTGYGSNHFQKGLREIGYAIQHDIEDAINWAKENDYGANGNICIAGASFGAYVSLRAATIAPDEYRCVIAIAGFYDINSLLAADEKAPFFPIMKAMYGDPEKDRERLKVASPINDIAKLKAPVLLVHGELDPRIKFQQATELLAVLQREHKTYEVLFRHDEGHGFRKSSNRQKLFRTIENFLEHYMPVEQASPAKN